ncbi:MAG: hypothetical protein ACU83O_00185, partial [Gammaproteobacteria bacterium]
RDSQISDLETKLIIAQNSLQYKTSAKLFQAREKLVNGLDNSLINTLLGHIQNYLGIVLELINETQAFIRRKYRQVLENFKIALNILQQVPGQAYDQFQSRLVEPSGTFVKTGLEYGGSSCKKGREWLRHEVLDPGLALWDRVTFLARELPLDARIILQTRVIEPALRYADKMPVILNGVWADLSVWIKNLMNRLRHLLKQCWEYIEEQITRSSFWDGKQRMQASA